MDERSAPPMAVAPGEAGSQEQQRAGLQRAQPGREHRDMSRFALDDYSPDQAGNGQAEPVSRFAGATGRYDPSDRS